MCLHEMAESWSWSLRAIRSLQILAEGWAINEKTISNKTASSEQTRPGTAEELFDSTHQNFSHADSQKAILDVDDGVLDWLMDYDSTVRGPAIESLVFDQHLWPTELSSDESGSIF